MAMRSRLFGSFLTAAAASSVRQDDFWAADRLQLQLLGALNHVLLGI